MAIVGNFPGVYPTITDLSQVVTANSVTSCAYVGEAEFGPINTPTLITNKKGYIERFGEIKSKYGYMGYSLAVAADTVGQHYVVRVVNNETARFGYGAIPLTGKTVEQPEDGLTVDQAKDADKDPALLFRTVNEETEEIVYDKDSAFKVVANNPNNKDIRVNVYDSTINTNKQYKSLKTYISELDESGEVEEYKVCATISEEGTIEEGDTIIVTCSEWTMTDEETGETLPYKKNFTVDSIENSYYYSVDVVNAGVDYVVGDKLTLTGATLSPAYESHDLQCEVTEVDELNHIKKVVVLTTSDYNKIDGTFETTTDSAYGSGATIKVASKERKDVVTYTDDEQHEALAHDDSLRILKYPDAKETTFTIEVLEVKDKNVETVEIFKYLTLFENKDQYGNSTFIEDAVNGKSTYIKAYANPNIEEEYPVPTFDFYKVDHGNSKDSPTMAELVAAWDLFKDRSQTTVNLLMNSGYINEGANLYQQAMLAVAEKRRDCFCLFDVPSTSTDADQVLDWRKNEMGFNTYRGAVFTPWVKSYDSINGKRNFNMCPSAYIAKIMGAAGKPWIAAAGPNRGYYTSSIVSPTGLTSYYDEETGGVLYQNQLNCGIKDIAGYANWGQKTLQMKPSALDRINVARTVIYVETTLRDAARYHLFENNTAFERMQITLQFNQFLDEIVNGGGLTRYQVICDESNNTPYIIQQNQLVIDIYLWPVYTTEFIALNTIVMGAEAEVSIASSAV